VDEILNKDLLVHVVDLPKITGTKAAIGKYEEHWPDQKLKAEIEDEHGRVLRKGETDPRLKGFMMRPHPDFHKDTLADVTAHGKKSPGGIVARLLTNYKPTNATNPFMRNDNLGDCEHGWAVEQKGIDKKFKVNILYDNKKHEIKTQKLVDASGKTVMIDTIVEGKMVQMPRLTTTTTFISGGKEGKGFERFKIAEDQDWSQLTKWRPCSLMQAFREYWKYHTYQVGSDEKAAVALRFYKMVENCTPKDEMRSA
jgi:hypothetical protein